MPNRSDGNRQDNRQRGNAAQLLEKYKALARDAQLAGDRVQTEYYLQFADHYFRVLEDGRSRFEEQNQRRRGNEDDEDEGADTVSADADNDYDDEDGEDERPQPVRRERSQRPERTDRQDRSERNDRPERTERAERTDRPERTERTERNERPDRQQERSERPRRERPAPVPVTAEADERIAVGVLPPSIGVVTSVDDDAEAPRPRRRVRKPREVQGGDDIAPAA